MFDRRLIQNFDWTLMIVTLLLAVFGLITLFSAAKAGFDITQAFFFKQVMWYGVGYLIMIASFFISYKRFDQYAYLAYGMCLFLLVAVLLVGKLVAGSKRWLVLGPISFQPSEFAKIAVILVLARYYSRTASIKGMRIRDLFIPMLLTALPFVLIVKQPDLGTGMMILLIAASLTLFVKIEKYTMIAIAAFGTVIVPLVWMMLKGYQKQRILTFLEPDRDPLGAGYHIIQSKIAIGSGMLTGKGFLKGTQNALSFLPEHQTDFIFSVLAEDWGFIGSVFLLMIFMFLIFWSLNIAHGCRNAFGTLMAIGITALIGWEVFINIGMVMGLMPVVGIPLPFVSYGGSAILCILLCIGILMNISMRKYLID
jgi:rod shape determining protein RodA